MNSVSLDFVSGNIEILGKQNSLFPSGPVIKCLMFRCNNFYSVKSLFNFPNLHFNANLEGKKLFILLLKCCFGNTTILYSDDFSRFSKKLLVNVIKDCFVFPVFSCSLIVDNSSSKQTRQITC